jgi:hypothetical protein
VIAGRRVARSSIGPGGAWKNDAVSDVYDDGPAFEKADPFVPPDAAEAVSLDSEIDFDDEQEEDQVPLDVVEAIEAGVLLDDPEKLDDGTR